MAAFRAAFQLWQDVANVTFVEAADGVNGTAGIVRVGNADLSDRGRIWRKIFTPSTIASGVSTYGEILVDPLISSGSSFAIGTRRLQGSPCTR